MKSKIYPVYNVNGLSVCVIRKSNDTNGSPTYECYVINNDVAYKVTGIKTYKGELGAAEDAIEKLSKNL